jgi:hypothetical protein
MPDNKAEQTQADKFRDLARELECDDDEAAFDEALNRIARAPRKSEPDLKDDDH